MNNQVKILLTISGIPGATLHTTRVKVPFSITKEDIHFQNTGKLYKGRDNNKIVRKGVRKFYDIEVVPCTKSIKMTVDAYDYMTSIEIPTWYHKKDWKRLSTIQRLELHLQRICDANNGKEYSYSILEE